MPSASTTGPIAVTDEPADRQRAALIAADDGPSLSSVHGQAGHPRAVAGVPDAAVGLPPQGGRPHTFAIPRLGGRAKAAMVEIQADEYGGGTAARMHSELFGGLMRDLDLDSDLRRPVGRRTRGRLRLGQHDVPVRLHRRCGARPWPPDRRGDDVVGAQPPVSAGLRGLGFGERTTVFYDEHVEADAVHEQIASVDMCGSLVAEQPDLLPTSCSVPPRRWPWTPSPRSTCRRREAGRWPCAGIVRSPPDISAGRRLRGGPARRPG